MKPSLEILSIQAQQGGPLEAAILTYLDQEYEKRHALKLRRNHMTKPERILSILSKYKQLSHSQMLTHCHRIGKSSELMTLLENLAQESKINICPSPDNKTILYQIIE